MRNMVNQTLKIISILLFFYSCERDNKTQENYIISNGEKIIIELARLIQNDGETVTGLKEFFIEFYSPGVSFFENIEGYDSIVYQDNSYRLYYDLFKPENFNGFSGEYNFYIDTYPYTNDSAFSFNDAGFYNSRTNNNGIQYSADSGKVVILEDNGIFDIDFSFIRNGDEYWPENINLKGRYIGTIQIEGE